MPYIKKEILWEKFDLNFKGMACPMPVIKLSMAMKKAATAMSSRLSAMTQDLNLTSRHGAMRPEMCSPILRSPARTSSRPLPKNDLSGGNMEHGDLAKKVQEMESRLAKLEKNGPN